MRRAPFSLILALLVFCSFLMGNGDSNQRVTLQETVNFGPGEGVAWKNQSALFLGMSDSGDARIRMEDSGKEIAVPASTINRAAQEEDPEEEESPQASSKTGQNGCFGNQSDEPKPSFDPGKTAQNSSPAKLVESRSLAPSNSSGGSLRPDQVSDQPRTSPGRQAASDSSDSGFTSSYEPSGPTAALSSGTPLVSPNLNRALAMQPGSSSRPTASDSSPLRSLPNEVLPVARNIAAEEVVKRAQDAIQEVQRKSTDDILRMSREVESRIQQTPPKPLLENTLANINRDLNTIQSLDFKTNPADYSKRLDPDDVARVRNALLNNRNKVENELENLNSKDLTQRTIGGIFPGLPGPGALPNPRELASRLFESGFPFASPTTDSAGKPIVPNPTGTSQTTNKILAFAMLSREEQEKIAPQLKLAEKRKLRTKSGDLVDFTLLHSGYLLGGGKTAMDCSSFVGSVLPNHLAGFRLTTLDLRTIWLFLKDGKFPKPPVYEPARFEQVKRLADAFVPVDLKAGEPLMPGDLLIYRTNWEAIGHVFITKSYDHRIMRAAVIEAAQSAGTVRERDFDLAINDSSRTVRAGFMALRLKPVDNKACKYTDNSGARSRGISGRKTEGAI